MVPRPTFSKDERQSLPPSYTRRAQRVQQLLTELGASDIVVDEANTGSMYVNGYVEPNWAENFGPAPDHDQDQRPPATGPHDLDVDDLRTDRKKIKELVRLREGGPARRPYGRRPRPQRLSGLRGDGARSPGSVRSASRRASRAYAERTPGWLRARLRPPC